MMFLYERCPRTVCGAKQCVHAKDHKGPCGWGVPLKPVRGMPVPRKGACDVVSMAISEATIDMLVSQRIEQLLNCMASSAESPKTVKWLWRVKDKVRALNR